MALSFVSRGGSTNKAKDVMEILHYGDESVSVAMEEVEPQDWSEKVYKPDIKHNWDKVYRMPGYDKK